MISKHNRKAVDFARYNALKLRDETPDKKLHESAQTFQSLHISLLEELPTFLSLTCEFVEAIVNQFSLAQAAWYRAWMGELAKIVGDASLLRMPGTEAFVNIVANFLEHYESQRELMEAFSIVNGTETCFLVFCFIWLVRANVVRDGCETRFKTSFLDGIGI